MGMRDKFFSNPKVFRFFMNLYSPLWGASIKVRSVSNDFRKLTADLHPSRFNTNALGTHFGGSLYAMTDPFYVLMFISNLGKQYIVWDLAAKIDFLKPGLGVVSATFTLSQADIDAAIAATANGEKYTPVFLVDVCNAAGEVVARVEKTIYIRRKKTA